jgi:hypothetical protein
MNTDVRSTMIENTTPGVSDRRTGASRHPNAVQNTKLLKNKFQEKREKYSP